MAYYNPIVTGRYNPIYTANNQGQLVTADICIDYTHPLPGCLPLPGFPVITGFFFFTFLGVRGPNRPTFNSHHNIDAVIIVMRHLGIFLWFKPNKVTAPVERRRFHHRFQGFPRVCETESVVKTSNKTKCIYQPFRRGKFLHE